LGRQEKSKVFREPVEVAARLLIETFGFHPVQFGQVRIQQDLVTANDQDGRSIRSTGIRDWMSPQSMKPGGAKL
jgi:hypothetical protein